jgi:hydroxymethylpyrimidine pyrophosphatase-like HAD family hydrolase/DNA-binding NarL/FixJ family response regulator
MSEPKQATARILIVDDSMGVARSLSLGLGLYQNGVYRIETCTSAEEALQRVVETPFDLVISDLRLPGMDGLTFLERMAQVNPSIRSILITAYGSAEVEARGSELANAYLAKPFLLQDIIRLVDRILSEPIPIQGPEVAVSAVEPAAGLPKPQAEMRKAVHLTVLACDLDGTLAEKGRVAVATWQALRSAKTAGIVLILVTGRTLDQFLGQGSFGELFEAIVAENGAVVHFPRRDVVELPFGRVDSRLLSQLEQLKVPLERGMAIAATVLPHDETVLWQLRETRCSATIEYNRSAVMLLPAGATKGNGLLFALQELGYSPHNVVACGDAENDRSLLSVAELGVAVANAEPSLRQMADVVLSGSDGVGVQELLQAMVDGNIWDRRRRASRSLVIGQRSSGSPVRIDPFALIDSNTAIFGASGSGKSWLAGLLVEELLKQKYQVCIIDPEGDYRSLATSPRSLLLGGPGGPLPPVADVLNIAEWNDVSLVLDLSVYGMEQRLAYVEEFLAALRGLRSRRGRPHYFLVDEIQSFCPPHGGGLSELFLSAMAWGGFGVVSYRPSQLAGSLLDRLDHFLITRLSLPEEINAVRRRLKHCSDEVASAIPVLSKGQALLCGSSNGRSLGPISHFVRFNVGSRTIPHVRHLHKYLRAPLPAHKRFRFTDPSGRSLGSAANLWEFREQLVKLPSDSIGFHLARGDFSRWLQEVLHDEELARRVSKLAKRDVDDETLRQMLLEMVVERYEELEAWL